MLETVAARYGDDAAEGTAPPGAVARFFGVIARNPGRALSLIVIIGGAAAIVANAAFFQTAEHPAPLFATRDGAAAAADPAGTAGTLTTTERVDELGRLVELTAVDPPQVQATAASANVVEVQRLLTEQGYQPGIVDGLYGTRTRQSIEAYQRDHNLTVTGVVTAELVAQLRQTAASPAPVASGQPTESAKVLAVQTALNQAGYGPVSATGELTPETAGAIRRFQLDHGLTLTGRVDEDLIARMVAIGALDPP